MASQVDWTDHYEIEDGMYVEKSMIYGKEAYITCPDASTGLGGGEVYMKKYGDRRDPVYKFEQTLRAQKIFDGIRNRIDEALKPLMGLPVIDQIESQATLCKNATSLIIPETVSDGDRTITAGTVGTDLGDVKQKLNNMNGQFVRAFSKVVTKMISVDEAQACLPRLCHRAFAAESAMFSEVRDGVLNVVMQAIEVFKSVQMHQEKGFEVVISAAQKVVEIYSALTGKDGKVIAGLKFGLENIGDLVSNLNKNPCKEFEDAMSTFEGNLKAIVDIITKIETKIADNLRQNYDHISSEDNRQLVDIKLAPISSDEVEGANVLDVNETIVGDVSSILKNEVSSQFTLASSTMAGVNPYGPLRRQGKVTEVSQAISNLQWLFVRLAKELAWDINEAADNFKISSDYIHNQDQENVEKLKESQSEIETGSSYDTWSNKNGPGLPNTGR